MGSLALPKQNHTYYSKQESIIMSMLSSNISEIAGASRKNVLLTTTSVQT